MLFMLVKLPLITSFTILLQLTMVYPYSLNKKFGKSGKKGTGKMFVWKFVPYTDSLLSLFSFQGLKH